MNCSKRGRFLPSDAWVPRKKTNHIYRARTELETMGDWTTRFDQLADHLSQYIRGGIVFQYTGPYRWKIQGLAEIPDTLDLADDHVQFKRSKIANQKRKAKAKMQAVRCLKLSEAARAGSR